MRLVPDDNAGLADLVKARPAREEGVYDRRNMLQVLQEELALYTTEHAPKICGQDVALTTCAINTRTRVVGGGGGGLRGRPLLMGPLAAFILEYTSLPSSSYAS